MLGTPNVKSRAISSEAFVVIAKERSTTKCIQSYDSGRYS
uniref:Uncharacterized protein n=1 Tax=Staphylococcus phage HS13 TaxID=3056403 RepID=A0AA50AFM1_9VIRU|nr:MAG: hypothetical protein [Staphylococcus phage HS13]DAI53266.1 MAG TPA: hypothetical protein [Caudoviricetes sp.]